MEVEYVKILATRAMDIITEMYPGGNLPMYLHDVPGAQDDFDVEPGETPNDEMSIAQIHYELTGLACDEFISNTGRTNWPSKKLEEECRELGFKIKIYAGEEDSFGWLTGCFDITLIDGDEVRSLPTIVYG